MRQRCENRVICTEICVSDDKIEDLFQIYFMLFVRYTVETDQDIWIDITELVYKNEKQLSCLLLSMNNCYICVFANVISYTSGVQRYKSK